MLGSPRLNFSENSDLVSMKRAAGGRLKVPVSAGIRPFRKPLRRRGLSARGNFLGRSCDAEVLCRRRVERTGDSFVESTVS